MSTKKEQENEEMFEDCPKAVKEYEAESGVKSFIKKPYVEFFIQSLNYFDDYEVKIPKGTIATYGTYAQISHTKKVSLVKKNKVDFY
tara:strand:- start:545 stop:805 length:261 start_codon:yes stop_codon:yes gene_type:complete